MSSADPCLMVYPGEGTVIYHYEPTEYYVVGPGHPLYDPAYDRGGYVLIDINTDQIAEDVYQAGNLAGFQMDSEHQGYFIHTSDFTITVDGYNNAPITYTNVLLVFDLIEPPGCVPNTITVDGNPVLYDPSLGYYYPIGDFVVSTQIGTNKYSDTQDYVFSWYGCHSVRIWAFADDDYDLTHTGMECFSAYSHDLTVRTEVQSWGSVKSKYQ